ncbi:DUF1499 domain-containing protein [Exilibacterium tricleocarpae]|uniref:DUF1499 domain-containing protein n=1 Tax=Exilibacterium tricleocarpae TaxID=2591008 RepID=A0A545T8B8_9GAMM|nr:DUF1499 domain-containing protein [Exilibacterium tricleocarpae]TQV73473.1 DUF1499 domain-containing protein [Exilibacterium tricleocarpae]
MNRVLFLVTRLVLVVSVGVFLTLLLAGPAYRFELWELGTAFSVSRGAATVAAWTCGIAVALLLAWALVNKRLSKSALTAVLLCGIPLVPLYQFQQTARSVPPIHDITTDTANPPVFVAIAPLRADAPNPVEYLGGEVTRQQLQAYPDIVSIDIALDTEQAHAKALEAVAAMGWELVDSEVAQGRIEATDTTFWFGYKDDVVIRITDKGAGSRLDIRSKSRVGGSDVGLNAKRIRAYRDELMGSL